MYRVNRYCFDINSAHERLAPRPCFWCPTGYRRFASGLHFACVSLADSLKRGLLLSSITVVKHSAAKSDLFNRRVTPKRFAILLCSLFLAISMPACGDHDHDDHSGHDHHGHDHDGHNHDPNEVMTTLNLTFTPDGEGDPVMATWADPEQDGMPKIDTITLEEGKTYTLTIEVLNELEMPSDVTKELLDELDEQFFFTGESVASPASTSTAAIISQDMLIKMPLVFRWFIQHNQG